MRLCFIGSGVEREDTLLPAIDITNVARIFRQRYDTLIFGGSKVGLMGAFASEFLATGGEIISVIPQWLADAELAYSEGQIIECRTLAERKEILFASTDALLCYPGGIGTYDELFDYLARHAVQEMAAAKNVYFYNYNLFYAPLLLQLETALEAGLIAPVVMEKLMVFDSPQTLAEMMKEP